MKTIITFFLLVSAFCIHAQTYSSSSGEVDADSVAEFPGGEKALSEYLNKVPYPSKAKQDNIEGEVTVQFMIDVNGKVTNIQVAQSSGSELLDNSAVEHMEKMPKWKPAIQYAQPTPYQMVVPVRFRIVTSPKKK